jgi:hypothetical protein
MRGIETVILVSPAVPEQEIAAIDSAVRAGVGHVVKITSKASADSPVERRRGPYGLFTASAAVTWGYASGDRRVRQRACTR